MRTACGINTNAYPVLLIKEVSRVFPVAVNNMTLWTEEPRLMSECLVWLFPLFLLCLHQALQTAEDYTDGDGGGNERQGRTSEAGLVFNKRGDQTCSQSVKENIILGSGGTG